ncbi:MAG: autotransporter-associated beta strand repeat-containing protein, partial [Kiritimatiellaeota bacterium]|nr:autotransporter-associated beta strand repeat-containing protein [Kiritimatiellota bacterium]
MVGSYQHHVVIFFTNTSHIAYYTAANGNSVFTNSSSDTGSSGRVLRLGDSGGSGTLYITGGTLQTIPSSGDLIGNGSTGILVVDGGIYSTSGTLILGNAGGTGTLTINSGTAVVSKVQVGGGSGGASTSTINLNGGLLSINQLTMGGADVLTVNLSNGTLQAAASTANWLVSTSGTYNVTGPVNFDTQAFNVTNAAPLRGAGGVTKIGSGMLTLSGSNAITGGLTLNAGTLTIGNNYALGAGAVVINGGTLDDTTGAHTISGVTGYTFSNRFTLASAQAVNLGAAGVVLGANITVTDINTGTIGGNVSDGGNNYSLTKAGAGILVLGGTNTYTGGTTINNGTLRLGVFNALLSTGVVTVAGGG